VLIRLLGNFLKPFWLLRLCCLKPIAHRCRPMVVNCGHRRFSIHIISWKLHDGFRLLRNEPRWCSASSLFVHHNVPTFDALIRKLIYALWRIVVTTVLMFWLINCSHQTFILSLSYLNVGASYCTTVVFCCFLKHFPFLHSLLYSHRSWALHAIEIKWNEVKVTTPANINKSGQNLIHMHKVKRR